MSGGPFDVQRNDLLVRRVHTSLSPESGPAEAYLTRDGAATTQHSKVQIEAETPSFRPAIIRNAPSHRAVGRPEFYFFGSGAGSSSRTMSHCCVVPSSK